MSKLEEVKEKKVDVKLNVYQKLNKVQTELKAPKGQFNKFGNYKYRSCEDILEGLKSLLKEVGAIVLLSDSVEFVEGRYYVKARAQFVDTDTAEKIEVSAMAREEETKKGMDSSQITGSTSSYARKYALNGLFCIDDTKDSDATNDHAQGTTQAKNTTYTRMTNQHLNKLFELGNKKGYSQDKVRQRITKKFNKTAEEMTTAEYKQVVLGYEKLPDKE